MHVTEKRLSLQLFAEEQPPALPPELPPEAAPPMTQEDTLQAHFRSLQEQEAALQQIYPDFRLAEELKNPIFLRMTAPDIGIPLADAYFAVHHQELQAAVMQVTAQRTAQKLAQSLRAGAMRPDETGGAQAPSVSALNYAAASRQQREQLKRKIRNAAAQGKRLYPGQG